MANFRQIWSHCFPPLTASWLDLIWGWSKQVTSCNDPKGRNASCWFWNEKEEKEIDGCPGLVVMGGELYPEGRGFEFQHDWYFSHKFVVKIVMIVWKDKNKRKRGPFKKRRTPIDRITDWQNGVSVNLHWKHLTSDWLKVTSPEKFGQLSLQGSSWPKSRWPNGAPAYWPKKVPN